MRSEDYIAKLMSIARQDTPERSLDVRIAQTMLAHLKELGDLQNKELAALCYVDGATISRFVRSLGFLKYGEFKSYFNEHREIYNESYYYKKDKMPSGNEMFVQSLRAMVESYDMLDEQQLNRIAKLLKTSSNILLGGDRYSELVAQDFQMKLLTLGIYAKTYGDVNLQYQEVKQNKGLFIIFTASYIRSRPIISLALKNGWKVVVITRNKEAEADEVILYDDVNTSDWSVNSVNDRLCMAMIVDQITLKIASSAINEK